MEGFPFSWVYHSSFSQANYMEYQRENSKRTLTKYMWQKTLNWDSLEFKSQL